MIDNEFLLQDRLQKIQQIIGKYGEENFYISFSGGKDSVVVSALVDMAIPDNTIPRVYSNTGIELNIIKNFVLELQKNDPRIEVIQPAIPIKRMLEQEGYPFKSKEHSHIWDVYSRNGMDCKTVQKYMNGSEKYGKRYICPNILRYQFSEGFKNRLKVSDKCCVKLKEEPLDLWAKENNKTCKILGLMPSEGGRRTTTKCLAFKNRGKILSFHPLSPVTKEWEDWLISEYNIPICDIYKNPYNFERTGCKGCPFNFNLQKDLDILEKYFPGERKQCEAIWKPVYDEYRKLGYRLRPLDEGE